MAPLRALTLFFFVFFCGTAFSKLGAQTKRMVIDGSIRLEESALPSTALIRILRSDSIIAKTIFIYDPFKGKFGVRVSTADGFEDDERILFRVVVSSKDSFLARMTSPVVFKGTDMTSPAPNIKTEIFRNHIPQLRRTMPDTTIHENQSLRFRLVAIDLDGDTIKYRLVKAAPSTSMDSITGLFSWKPGFDDSGVYEVVFAVEDGYDRATSKTVVVTVKNVNRPPQFTQILPDTVIREGETLRFFVKAGDPDNDGIVFSHNSLPFGAMFSSSDGIFEWTPNYEQTGEYIFTLSVLDESNAGASRTSRITVLNVNRPPVFTNVVADTSVAEDNTLNFQFTAMDPDDDGVRFSLASGPPGSAISGGGLFSWRPNFRQAGDHEVVVQVSDDTLQTQETLRIHVDNVNRLPTLPRLLRPSSSDTINVTNGKPVVFAWRKSSDEDVDDTLSYALHLKGELLDTTIVDIHDSTTALNIRARLRANSLYTWSLSVTDGWTVLRSPESYSFRTSGAPVKESTAPSPRIFSLEHNYPNPFNPVTSIRYTIPERSFVRLTVWNMLGELVQQLVSEEKDAGIYENAFRAESLPSGVYLVKLEAHPISGLERKDFISTKKMILVK
ncbi:MAG: putative Ig domain-containing protein [Ignavibacteriales bacterium]|nr:putative Ig domain-containing protein [Ignavibacteriales bacterium]